MVYEAIAGDYSASRHLHLNCNGSYTNIVVGNAKQTSVQSLIVDCP